MQRNFEPSSLIREYRKKNIPAGQQDFNRICKSCFTQLGDHYGVNALCPSDVEMQNRGVGLYFNARQNLRLEAWQNKMKDKFVLL